MLFQSRVLDRSTKTGFQSYKPLGQISPFFRQTDVTFRKYSQGHFVLNRLKYKTGRILPVRQVYNFSTYI